MSSSNDKRFQLPLGGVFAVLNNMTWRQAEASPATSDADLVETMNRLFAICPPVNAYRLVCEIGDAVDKAIEHDYEHKFAGRDKTDPVVRGELIHFLEVWSKGRTAAMCNSINLIVVYVQKLLSGYPIDPNKDMLVNWGVRRTDKAA